MQKFSVILSIFLSVLITILFLLVSRSLERENRSEQDKTERILQLSMAMSVNAIQDEISFTYRELSDLCKDAGTDIVSDEEALFQYIDSNLEKSLFAYEILKDRSILHLNGSDENPVKTYMFGNNNLSMESVFIRLDSQKTPEMIFVNNFHGFMIFPLGEKRFLFYTLDLQDMIFHTMASLFQEFTRNSPELSNRYAGEFTSQVLLGEEISENELIERNDLIVDLNRMFNINRIIDYHKSRQERNYILFEDISDVEHNHLYMVLQHESGSIEGHYREKLFTNYLVLAVLYLLILGSIASLLYTTFRVKKSVMREKEFTAMVSHELKTPLSVIKLGADNLSGGYIEDGQSVIEYGQMIRKETDRLGDMIGKILSITGRLDNDSLSRFSQADITEISENLRSQSQSLCQNHQVELTVQLDNEQTLIYCNKTTLTGALFNILQNSIIYGAAQGEDKEVRLCFSDQKRQRRSGLLISIHDFGPGISWKESQKVFNPFYRGSIGKERQIAGSGLGLSISRKIIKQHRGQLQLNRSLRKETVFEVWIPYRMKNEKNTHD